jgi:NAD(P)-dependent dehydrogenase (short-subunit alcohol dehydrogenase family)
MLPERGKDALIASAPPSREPCIPDEIASLAAFLASDDARWVSGAVLDVAGGWN